MPSKPLSKKKRAKLQSELEKHFQVESFYETQLRKNEGDAAKIKKIRTKLNKVVEARKALAAELF